MVVGELTESVETVVIGGGPGGYVAAIRLAQLGKEAMVISQDPLPGGECLHRGCIPSKALIEIGNLYRRIQDAGTIGIEVKQASINLPQVQKWKAGVIQQLAKGTRQLLEQHRIPYLHGRGSLLSPHEVEIQSETGLKRLRFRHAILATGSFAAPLPGLEFDGERILSSEHALDLQVLPSHLLVIGGGYIGLELGEVYAKLGSQVTVVEATEEILPGVDPDLKRPLLKRLHALGILVYLKTRFLSSQAGTSGLNVKIQSGEAQPIDLKVSHILVAVGRKPRSMGFGLEKAAVALDERGFARINRHCQTNIPHLYAIGDLAGGMMLAHKAFREGVVAAEHIAGKNEAFDNQVPAVIFTDPEIAYVGMTQAQAKEVGIETQTGLFGFAANGRALTLNDSEGFVKVVAEKGSGRILGVQMTGPHVSDLISEATLAIETGLTAEDLALTIHPHPTLSEALHEAAEGVMGMSLHRYQGRKQKAEKK